MRLIDEAFTAGDAVVSGENLGGIVKALDAMTIFIGFLVFLTSAPLCVLCGKSLYAFPTKL
jgi:hypothetical protein